MATQDSETKAAALPQQEPLLIRPGRPDEDADFAAQHIRDMAASQEGMLKFCRVGVADLLAAMRSGLVQLLVAEAGGCPAGFALYTRSHLQARPGLYLQALYVCSDHRRLQVGKSLLTALARRALATGADHLKLIVHADNPALDCYRRLAFRVLTETDRLAFVEMNDADFVARLLAGAERPLPDAARLTLQPCDGGDGWRFELRSSECDCRLVGTAALTYCIWQGVVAQIDIVAERPSCAASSECGPVSDASLQRLLGRLIQLAAAKQPALPQPTVVWIDAVFGGPTSGGLDELLLRAGFEDNSTNENWLICLLSGRSLPLLAATPLACRLHPELTDCSPCEPAAPPN